jgi:hypothetical protein
VVAATLLVIGLLAGITLLYGAGRTTSYPALPAALAAAPHGPVALGVVAVVAGLMFKAGGVPAQFWIPDVTEGTTVPVAAFVTTVPKIGGLVALFRLLAAAVPASAVDWPLLVAVLAAATMTLGNFAAFYQTSVKRLLGYSAISQAGYLLIAVAVAARSDTALRAMLFYLAAYAATNLAAFAVVAELPRARTIADYRGLAARHPGLAAVLAVSLLGLVGTPPTGVFLGKLQVFTAAIDGGYGWLAGGGGSGDVADDAHHPGLLVVDVVAVGHPLAGVARVEVAGDGLPRQDVDGVLEGPCAVDLEGVAVDVHGVPHLGGVHPGDPQPLVLLDPGQAGVGRADEPVSHRVCRAVEPPRVGAHVPGQLQPGCHVGLHRRRRRGGGA